MLIPYWFDTVNPKNGMRLHAKIIFYLVLFVTAWGQKPSKAFETMRGNIPTVFMELMENLWATIFSLFCLILTPIHLTIYLVIGLPIMELVKIKFFDNALRFILQIGYKEENK